MMKRSVAEAIAGHRVVCLTAEATVRAAADLMNSAHVASIVVIDGERRPIGIFTERDLTVRVVSGRLDPDDTLLDKVMTHTPLTTPANTSVREAVLVMHQNGLRHLPVVDGGAVVGVVSMRDFVGAELAATDGDCEMMDRLVETML